jgi:hypothetical protein
VQVRPRGGREAARRPRSQNSGALSQEVEPSESNAADMGVREPVDRLLACRRHPSSSARWAALDALSGLASSHTALLVPGQPKRPVFLETPLFDFLFARLAPTLGSRPQQFRLGQTGRQSPQNALVFNVKALKTLGGTVRLSAR